MTYTPDNPPTVAVHEGDTYVARKAANNTAAWAIAAVVAIVAILAVVFMVTSRPAELTDADLTNAAEQARLQGLVEGAQSASANATSAAQAAADRTALAAQQSAAEARASAEEARRRAAEQAPVVITPAEPAPEAPPPVE